MGISPLKISFRFIIFLMTVLPVACSKGNLKEDVDSPEVKVEAITGANQLAKPKQPLQDKVMFRFTNSENGEPLMNVPVTFKLMDITSAPQTEDAKLQESWKAGNLSASDPGLNSLPEIEVVGRVLEASATTNEAGIATVSISAPTPFGRTVAVLTQVEDSILGVGFGFTTFRTIETGSSGFDLKLSSSGTFIERSKRPFSLNLKLLEANEIVDIQGVFPIKISTVVPDTVAIHDLPQGEVNCEFFKGNCVIPGSPFVVEGVGDIRVTIESADFGATMEVIKVLGSEPFGVELSLSDPELSLEEVCADSKDKADTSAPCIVIPGGTDFIEFYPYLHDKDNKFLSFTKATWTVTGALEGLLNNPVSSKVQIVYPESAGEGTFTIETPSGFSKTYSYKVKPREPRSLTFATSNNGSEVAGIPFDITLTAKDINGQVVDGYGETLDLDFTTKGNLVAWNGVSSVLPSGTISCAFVDGVCKVLPPEGESNWVGILAEDNVVLSVKDPSGVIPDIWSTVVNIAKNVPNRLVLTDKKGGPTAEAKILDTELGILMSADHSRDIAAAITDEFYNYLNDADAIWDSGSSELLNGLSSLTGSFTVLSPTKPTVDTQLITVSAEGLSNSLPVKVVPGIPVRMEWIPPKNAWVNGTCQPLKFRVVDQHGNTFKDIPEGVSIRQDFTSSRPDFDAIAVNSVINNNNIVLTVDSANDGPRMPDHFAVSSDFASWLIDHDERFTNSVSNAYNSGFWMVYLGIHSGFNAGVLDADIKYCPYSLGSHTVSINGTLTKEVPVLVDPFSRELVDEIIEIQGSDISFNVASSGPKNIFFKYVRDTSEFEANFLTNGSTLGMNYEHRRQGNGRYGNLQWIGRRSVQSIFSVDSGSPLKISGTVVDGGGYPIRPASGTFTVTTGEYNKDNSSDLQWYVDESYIPSFTASLSELTVTETRMGPLQISMTDTDSGITTYQNIALGPGKPAAASLSRSNIDEQVSSITAVDRFNIRFNFFDEFGNPLNTVKNLDGTVNEYLESLLESGFLSLFIPGKLYFKSTNPILFNLGATSVTITHDGQPSPKGSPVEIDSSLTGTSADPIYSIDNVFFPKADTPQSITVDFGDVVGFYDVVVSDIADATIGFVPPPGPTIDYAVWNDDLTAKITENPSLPSVETTIWRFKKEDAESNLSALKTPESNVEYDGVLTNNAQYSQGAGDFRMLPEKDGNFLQAGTSNFRIYDTIEGYDIDLGTVTFLAGEPYEVKIAFVTPPPVEGNKYRVEPGTVYDITLQVLDKNGNPVNTVNGDFPVLWDKVGFDVNSELKTILFPQTTHCRFVDGICSVGVTDTNLNDDFSDETPIPLSFSPLSTKGDLKRLVATLDYGEETFPSLNFDMVMDPGPLHHYGVDGPGSYLPKNDLSTTFNVDIYPRDEQGNNIPAAEVPAGSLVAIELVRNGGGSPSGSLTATNDPMTGIDMTSGDAEDGRVRVRGLAYDEHGNHKVIATDNNAITTPLLQASTIAMVADLAQVVGYSLDLADTGPASETAGENVYIVIEAVNNYGNKVPAVALGGFSFTFTGAGNAPKNGASPVFGSPSGLISGSGTATVVFKASEVIPADTLRIEDDQGTGLYGTNLHPLTINPGELDYYTVTANETARTADSQPSGLFEITVSAFDPFGNPRNGQGALDLDANFVSGEGSPGSFYSDTMPFGTPNNFSMTSNSVVTFTNVYYPVGHTITLGLDTDKTVENPFQMDFTNTIHTVVQYYVGRADVAVGDMELIITARDAAGNVIQDIDTLLEAQTYCWAGPGTSPFGDAPIFDSTGDFTNGFGVFNVSFYRAQQLNETLVVTDDFGGACTDGFSSPPVGSRFGKRWGILTLLPQVASTLDLEVVEGEPVTAGAPFNLRVSAVDQYGNLASGLTNDDLSFVWSGANNSIVGDNPPTTLATANQFFSGGVFTSSGAPFVLYNTSDPNPTLTVTAINSTLQTVKDFGAMVTDNTVSIRIHETSSVTNLANALVTTSVTTDDIMNLWSHGYDQWGNYTGLISTDWSVSGDFVGDLTATNPSNQATIEPTTIGTGKIKIVKGGFPDYETDTITITQGLPSYLIFTTGTNDQAAGDCGTVTIQVRDMDHNPAGVLLDETINLGTDGDAKFYSDNGCTNEISSFVMLENEHTKTVYFLDYKAEGPLTVSAYDNGSDWTPATQNPTIVPSAPTIISVETAANDIAAGQCGLITFQVEDNWQNQVPLVSLPTSTFDLTHNGDLLEFFEESDCSGFPVNSVSMISNTKTFYVKDVEANQVQVTIDEQVDNGFAAAQQNQIFNLGTFSVTPLPGFVNTNTPTINWTTPNGGKYYDLLIDNDSGCPSPSVTYNSLEGNSKVLNPLSDGVYFACLTADGRGAPNVVASGSNFTFTLDITLPTPVLSNTPANPSNINNLNVSVGPQNDLDIFEYKSQIITGNVTCPNDPNEVNYSGWITGSTPITTAVPTPQGDYTLCVIGKDKSGNITSDAVEHVWERDTIPPTANTASEPTSINNANSINIDVLGTQVVQYQYKFSNTDTCSSASGYTSAISETTNITGTLSSRGIVDGSVFLCVVGKDAAGNWQDYSTATKKTWTRDTVAPDVTLSAAAVEFRNAQLAVTSVVTDTHAIASYQWRDVASTGNISFTAPTAQNSSVDSSSDGTYTIELKATDVAGNEGTDTFTLEWDQTPPVIGLSNTPAANSNVDPLAITINNYSNRDTYEFRYRLTEPAEADCSAPITEAWQTGANSITDDLGSDEFKRICIEARDRAGNVQTTVTDVFWNFDTTPPVATVSNTPADPDNIVTLDIDVAGTGVVRYKYKVVTAATACTGGGYSSERLTSAKIANDISGMGDGRMKACVIGKDSAGNWQLEASATEHEWEKDTDAPTAVINNAPTNYNSFNSNLYVTINGTDVTDYKFKVNSGTGDCGNSTGYSGLVPIATPITTDISGFAQGTITICVVGADAVGNVEAYSNAVTASWIKDTLLPTASVTGVPTGESQTASLDLPVTTYSDIEVKQFQFDLLGPGAPVDCTGATYGSWTEASSNLSEALGADGTYRLCVKGRDAALNEQATPTTYAWTKDTAAPTATISGEPTGTNNLSSIDVNVGGTGVTHYQWVVVEGSDTCSSATYSSEVVESTNITDITGKSDGDLFLCVIGRDAAGNWEAKGAAKASWTKDTTPPSLPANIRIAADVAGGSHAAWDNDDEIHLSWDASTDAIAGGVEYTVTYYTNNNCTPTGTDVTSLTGTSHTISSAPDGTAYTFRIKAADSLGNETALTSCSSSTTVDLTPPSAFTISAPTHQSVVYTLSPTISWSDPGNATGYDVKIVATNDCNASAVTTANTASLSSGITVPNDGTYYACVTASDDAGHTSDASNNPIEFEAETTVVKAAVTFDNTGSYGIKYLEWENGSWTTEDVFTASATVIDSRISLSLDTNDKAHLSYAKENTGDFELKYRERTAGSWSSEENVDLSNTVDIGQLSSLALDDGNNVYFSYLSDTGSSQDLKAANGTGAPFTVETVHAIGSGEKLVDSSIAIQAGTPDIAHLIYSYSNAGAYALKYRTNSGGWSSGVDETPGNLPTGTCDKYGPATIALEADGDAHIAYICETTGDVCYLYHATRIAGTWSHTQVGNIHATSCDVDTMSSLRRPSLRLDSSNKAHISVVTSTGDLKYYTNTSGSFAGATVDTSVDTTTAASLAFDGVPIILYTKSGALNFANKNSGSWVTSTVGVSNVTGVAPLLIDGVSGRSNR